MKPCTPMEFVLDGPLKPLTESKPREASNDQS
jgi:hypothetical protein